MNSVENLIEARKFAGLPPLTIEQKVELAEKKLSGKEKEEFLAKMGKSPKTKKDDEVDDGKPGPSKAARKAMDAATQKPSTKKRKTSEEINDVLRSAGVATLSEQNCAKIDAKFPSEK